jgi:NAD(P)-dependent dehydrogenase (short-subunit alcohol dehydrogenase family)
MKMFNVRVAIVEPGIIDTPMARGLVELPGGSLTLSSGASLFSLLRRSSTRRHRRWWQIRFWRSSIAALGNSGTRSDPNAGAFLKWRESMTDEEWVAFQSADDETWLRRMERDFGLTIPRN